MQHNYSEQEVIRKAKERRGGRWENVRVDELDSCGSPPPYTSCLLVCGRFFRFDGAELGRFGERKWEMGPGTPGPQDGGR